ncbi:hypothetical protein ACTFIY_008781 [Dictyostelium cf. discoideum]
MANIPAFNYIPLLNGEIEISRELIKELVAENNLSLWIFNVSFSKREFMVNEVQQIIRPSANNCYDPIKEFLTSLGFAKVSGGQTSTYVTKGKISLRNAEKIRIHLKTHFGNNNLPKIHIVISQPQLYD